MDAWEFDDVEAARAASGRLYHEFLRVPDLSAGIYVLEAGATDPQSPHTEDELYYVVAGRGAGHGRRRDAAGRARFAGLRRRPASRTASTTSPSASSSSSCSDPPRATARRRTAASRRRRPATSRNAERQLGAAPDLVVAEEHERVVAGRQERLEPRGPGRELARRRSRAGAGAGTGTARSGGGSAARSSSGSSVAHSAAPTAGQRGERLVDVPRRVLELHRQGQVARATRRAARPASRRRAATPSGHAEQDGPEPLPERPVRPGQPRHAAAPDRPGARGTSRRAGP